MKVETITFFNWVLHSLVLGALGGLTVCCCLRDARRRAHAALLAVILVLVAPLWVAEWPYPYHVPEAPVLARIHQALQTEWHVKVSPAPIEGMAKNPAETKAPALTWTWDDLAAWLRKIGGAGFAMVALIHLRRTWRAWRWRSLLRAPTAEEWCLLPQEAKRKDLRVFDHEGSPCVAGLFQPVIAVPASAFQSLDARQWRWLLRHEGEHLRGADVTGLWLLGWVRAFGWWNPFVHVLVECWTRSREQVCDAVALDRAEPPEAYAEFLLEVASGHQMEAAGTLPVAQSRPARRLRARLAALMAAQPVRERLGSAYLTFAGACYLLGYFLTASIGMTARADENGAKPVAAAAGENSNQQFTRTFKVPPDFLTRDLNAGERLTAMQRLAKQGIEFPEGASATFNAATSQLVVKNTPVNLDNTQTIVDAFVNASGSQLYVTASVVEAGHTFGTHGSILKSDEARKQFAQIIAESREDKAVRLSSAPTVAIRMGQRAVIELSRTSPEVGEKKFVGIRVEVGTLPIEHGLIEAKVQATVGREEGRPLSLYEGGHPSVNWRKVQMTSVETEQKFSSGGTLVLHLSTAAGPVTMLVAIHAHVSGKPVKSFEALPYVETVPLPPVIDDSKPVENKPARKIFVTAKMVEVNPPQGSAPNTLDFNWFTGGVPLNPPLLPVPQNGPPAMLAVPGLLSIAGVITDPQFQVIIRALKDAKITTLPDATIDDGKEFLFALPEDQSGGKLKVKTTIGPDGYTFDVDLTVVRGDGKQGGTTTVTIWDGQTVSMGGLFNVGEKEQRARLYFITAKMIEPAKK